MTSYLEELLGYEILTGLESPQGGKEFFFCCESTLGSLMWRKYRHDPLVEIWTTTMSCLACEKTISTSRDHDCELLILFLIK